MSQIGSSIASSLTTTDNSGRRRCSLSLTTRAAVVNEWGSPKLLDIPAPVIPDPSDNLVQVQVLGAALHSLVRARGNGKHYSVEILPHVIGVDGVGVLADGRLAYFTTYEGQQGSFTEVLNIPKKDAHLLPHGSDLWQIAALLNPAMSSWMAIKRRAFTLPARFSVLIMGATTMSGRLAVPLLRRLGANKIVGCARNEHTLGELDLDDRIVLKNPVHETDFSAIGHVDVVLDYLFGEPAAIALQSLRPRKCTQWMQIGSLAGGEIPFHHSLIRARNVVVMGSGLGSWSLDELQDELPELLIAMKDLPHQEINVLPIEEIENEWHNKRLARTVLKF